MLILSNIDRLYDGTGSTEDCLHRNVDLLLRDGLIQALEAHDAERHAAQGGPDHQWVDCSGLTLTPGLVDCHGHVTVLGISEEHMRSMQGASELLYVEKILYSSLVNGGVTTMRDIGGATDLMKRLVDSGVMIGPRLRIAIAMLSTTGGHADFRGPDRCHATLQALLPEGPGRPSSIVDGPWECRKRVREVAACGADLIKICASPGVASPGDQLEHQEFSPEEVAAICSEAAGRGLSVAAHAHSASGVKLAIENGVHDLQHISFMDERLVEMAFERGCSVTPTSWVVHELLKAKGLSDFVMDKVKRVAEVHAQAVSFAASGELPILVGTDPVLPGMHGRNFMELVYLIREGLSPLQAWFGATGLAAREIGQGDTGTVEAGQRADLLLSKENIITHPELMDRGALLEVIKDGFGHRAGLAGLPQVSFESTLAKALPSGPAESLKS